MMGIFGKSRKEKDAEKEAARQQVLDAFDQKHREIMETRDPAERIIKLEDHKQAIDVFVEAAKGEAVSKAKGKWLMGYLGGTVGTNLAIDAVSIMLFGVPASFLVMIPSMIIGFMTGTKRVVSAHQKMLEENKPLFAKLDERKAQADVAIDDALKGDMRDLAESPKFNEAMQRTPRLRDLFADAYRKHVLDGGMDGAPKPKKPNNGLNI